MIAVPAAIAVSRPEVDIVATAVLLLIHVPPVIISLRVVVAPIHKLGTPVIADTELTVTTIDVLHPAAVT